jgi:hypothetical protein
LPLFSARSALFDWNSPQYLHNMPLLLSGYDFWVIGEYIPSEMWRNFLTLAGSIGSQLSVAAAGLFLLAVLKRKDAVRHRLMLLVVFLVAALFPILYPTREKESFFLISFTLFLLFASAGLAHIAGLAKGEAGRKIAFALISLLIVFHSAMLLKRNADNFAERINTSGAAYSDAVFLSARRDALMLIDHVADDTIFPPVYEQFVNNKRRDIFIFHRLYLAFPWYMDSMRARAAEVGSIANFPSFNMEAERERVYEVNEEEKERREIGKTMNTISIDLQTVRLLESNMNSFPIYINTPNRFRRTRLSRGFDFAPAGALFMLGGSGAASTPPQIAGAPKFADKVFKEMVREIHVERGLWRQAKAAEDYKKNDLAQYNEDLGEIAADMETALLYKPDCDLNIILKDIYARIGRPEDAKKYETAVTECLRKKLDIR